MNPELVRQHGHADALCEGCSHSVHFLVRESCSRSFLSFRRRADQRVIGLARGIGIPPSALIPRGNKPLHPWSPVPAALHCFHVMKPQVILRFLSFLTCSGSVQAPVCRVPVGQVNGVTPLCSRPIVVIGESLLKVGERGSDAVLVPLERRQVDGVGEVRGEELVALDVEP